MSFANATASYFALSDLLAGRPLVRVLVDEDASLVAGERALVEGLDDRLGEERLVPELTLQSVHE